MNNSYGYYYGNEAEQYIFYRIPKVLFTDGRFKDLSAEAKILYGLMIDRMGLSIKNNWRDRQNKIYIYFTLDEVQDYMKCARTKSVKLMNELETIKLIERARQGQGKPSKIYVKKFFTSNDNDCEQDLKCSEVLKAEVSKPDFLTSQNQTSASPILEPQEVLKADCNNTNINNTNINNTDFSNKSYPYPIPSELPDKYELEEKENGSGGIGLEKTRTTKYSVSEETEKVKKRIEYEVMCHNFGRATVDEIVGLIVEVLLSNRQTICIASDDRPVELVKERFNNLNAEHIEYIIKTFQDNKSDIRSIKQYMLALLFNAPVTIESYYQAERW